MSGYVPSPNSPSAGVEEAPSSLLFGWPAWRAIISLMPFSPTHHPGRTLPPPLACPYPRSSTPLPTPMCHPHPLEPSTIPLKHTPTIEITLTHRPTRNRTPTTLRRPSPTQARTATSRLRPSDTRPKLRPTP